MTIFTRSILLMVILALSGTGEASVAYGSKRITSLQEVRKATDAVFNFLNSILVRERESFSKNIAVDIDVFRDYSELLHRRNTVTERHVRGGVGTSPLVFHDYDHMLILNIEVVQEYFGMAALAARDTDELAKVHEQYEAWKAETEERRLKMIEDAETKLANSVKHDPQDHHDYSYKIGMRTVLRHLDGMGEILQSVDNLSETTAHSTIE